MYYFMTFNLAVKQSATQVWVFLYVFMRANLGTLPATIKQHILHVCFSGRPIRSFDLKVLF